MTKIHLLSDLHIEFGAYKHSLPEADLLVLAGDIVVADRLRPGKTDKTSTLHKRHVMDFFKQAEALFGATNIIWIPGNHEYYHGTAFQESLDDINTFMEAAGFQTRCVNRQLIAFHDIVLVATTLWSDFEHANPMAMMAAQQGMNDYRLIQKEGTGIPGRSHGQNRTITTDDVLDQHLADSAFLLNSRDRIDTSKMVVVTHHAPSFRSIHPGYRDSAVNGAYATNLEHLMGGKIKLWLHGHVHNHNDYVINDTRVISNPRGYEGYELAPGFDSNFVVEI